MARMCSTKPLEHCISKLKNKHTAIEIGTYYFGWGQFLSERFDQVITLQSPESAKLNHVGSSKGEFSEDGLKWKQVMRERLPEDLHGDYSFDYLAKLIEPFPNVMQILHTSPPTIEFPFTYDLCTIDITRDPSELKKQYDYWKTKGNKDSILLMGIYAPREYDTFEFSQEDFLNSIEEDWEYYTPDPRYILIHL